MLDKATQTIWDEANEMVLRDILNSQRAHLLQVSLRLQADVVETAGRTYDAKLLRTTADELAARFLPPSV